MGNLIFNIIATTILALISPIGYKLKEKAGLDSDKATTFQSYVFSFTTIELWLSMVFCRSKLNLYFFFFLLIVSFSYKAFTEDILKNKYADDPRLYKISTISMQVILIIYQLIFFVTLEDGHFIDSLYKREFQIAMIWYLIVILWLSCYLSKNSLSKIFVEKDSYRKIFITLQILFIIIFVAFTIYNYININRFDFYLNRM